MKSHNKIEKVEAYRIYDKYFETEDEAIKFLDEIDLRWVNVCLKDFCCERYHDGSDIFVLKLPRNCVIEFKHHKKDFNRIVASFKGSPKILDFKIDILKSAFTRKKVHDIFLEVLDAKKSNMKECFCIYDDAKEHLIKIHR